ncbi:uncharacterized protein PG998_003418 [Apiospora kogelbergensis]|uniref:uncharacterized protein n=1 Tax=Apiospora kogelbergensis TaxID=1337665 RepID=UPI00312EC466
MIRMASAKEKSDDQHHYVPGFGDLADFISSDHDHSTAVYKRFDKLSARNLLYFQSELSRLQACQDAFDIEDRNQVEQTESWRGILTSARDWDTLRESLTKAPQTDLEMRTRKRMELAMEIRKTLKEYRETLIQESTLLSYEHPSTQSMKAVSNYFHQPVNNPAYPYETQPMLTGASSGLYPLGMNTSHLQASDCVALRPSNGSEPLTDLLKKYCSRIKHYSNHRVQLVASFITTLTAAGLLILPIYTLYRTAPSDPALTLGLIVLFTFVFAGAIVIMTKARRTEIFGACAAYAAVLVVFGTSATEEKARQRAATSDAPEIVEKMDWVFIEDRARLEGASRAGLGGRRGG